MINAKEELLLALKNTNSEVKCIKIEFGYYGNKEVWVLPVGYTEKDIEDFLNNLDFKYDSGYGGQLLYGNVWFTDGTWLERGEYDGSEWWEYKATPAIPEECRTINGVVRQVPRVDIEVKVDKDGKLKYTSCLDELL